ncbi:MAG TPA: MlaD family protein [Burkholderiales bacterium]
MGEPPHRPEPPDIPEAVAAPKSARSIQLVWLIPLIAVLVGGWLAVKAILDRGPVITISFETAEGLEAGKTKIKYKDVEVGLVNSVVLSNDIKQVIVTADLVKGAERYLVDDTRFWVVRPRITGGDVSGLGTLLSGAYIGLDIGKSGKPTRHFTGLKAAPVFSSDVPGREFVLRGSDLGSLDPGTPVYFRRLQVGQIASHALDKDGKGVTLKLFVNAPYDQYVTTDTRFWHASGFDVTLDASGVKIQTQSVVAMLSGGLAFETPAGSAALPPAAAGAEFRLFAHRAEAMTNPDAIVMKTVMVFRESVRGLAPGAPIDFRGIVVGEVTAIRVELDPVKLQITIPVEVNIYPRRLGSRLVKQRAVLSDRERREFLNAMMAKGLRAQLRTGNLLTGQLFIALDFFPHAPKVKTALNEDVFELHTVSSGLTELQETIASITKKIQDLPLGEISADLRQTLQSANRLIERFDTDLAPEARAALADVRKALAATEHALKPESPLQQDARDAMREIARAAQAFRILADYLERHPEALIQGKKEDEK